MTGPCPALGGRQGFCQGREVSTFPPALPQRSICARNIAFPANLPGEGNRGFGIGIDAMEPLPVALQEAIERGELTAEQLRQLITLEAEELGLTFEEAVKLARERRLPKTALGADLELLVQLLPA